MTEMTFGDLFRQGGFIMWVLVIASVVTWTISLERIYQLWRIKKAILNWAQTAQVGIKRETLESMVPGAPVAVSRIIRSIVDTRSEKIRDRRVSELLQYCRRNLWILGTVASATPFIGLYGTVVGIMKSFHQMGQTGAGGFGVVSAGISEALIATAGGLIVAIIALVLYNFFTAKCNEITSRARSAAEDTTDVLWQ